MLLRAIPLVFDPPLQVGLVGRAILFVSKLGNPTPTVMYAEAVLSCRKVVPPALNGNYVHY